MLLTGEVERENRKGRKGKKGVEGRKGARKGGREEDQDEDYPLTIRLVSSQAIPQSVAAGLVC